MQGMASVVSCEPWALLGRGALCTKARPGGGPAAGTVVAPGSPDRGRPRSRNSLASQDQQGAVTSGTAHKALFSRDTNFLQEINRKQEAAPTGTRHKAKSQGLVTFGDVAVVFSQETVTPNRAFSEGRDGMCIESGRWFHLNSSDERSHNCDSGKSFSSNPVVVKETGICSGKKLFQCNECKKTFTQSSSLTVHQRIHTGEKPYKCNQCGKAFSDGSSFARHQRCHTGKKPYECPECGKAFIQNTSLVRHWRYYHTGEKPFDCIDCGKAFSDHIGLNQHRRIHTGEKPFLSLMSPSCYNQVGLFLECKCN